MGGSNSRRAIKIKLDSLLTHLANGGERLVEIQAFYGEFYPDYAEIVAGLLNQLEVLIVLVKEFDKVI